MAQGRETIPKLLWFPQEPSLAQGRAARSLLRGCSRQHPQKWGWSQGKAASSTELDGEPQPLS